MDARPMLLTVISLLLTGCHLHAIIPVPSGGDHVLITQEQIERSGAQTAWEALKRLSPQFSFRGNRTSHPSMLAGPGRSTMFLSAHAPGRMHGSRQTDS